MANAIRLATQTGYKIEKGIPAPNAGRNPDFPFAEMSVGDSFQVADADAPRVRSAATYFMKSRPGTRFSIRSVDGGYRCWRIA